MDSKISRRHFCWTAALLFALPNPPATAREKWVVYSVDESNEPAGWVDALRVELVQIDTWQCWCKQATGFQTQFLVDGPLHRVKVLRITDETGEVVQHDAPWVPFQRRTKMYDLLLTLRKLGPNRRG